MAMPALQLPLLHQQCWVNKLLALPLDAVRVALEPRAGPSSAMALGRLCGERRVEGTLLLGKAESSPDDKGRKERYIQAMLFISPGSTAQTELSSITETEGGSD